MSDTSMLSESLEDLTVPDFFQEEGDEALRAQSEWLEEHLGLGSAFLATLLEVSEERIAAWREGREPLSPTESESLQELWRLVLHLLSFHNSDTERIRVLLERPAASPAESQRSPFAPPWAGCSMREHLETGGFGAIQDAIHWVTAFRFANPEAARLHGPEWRSTEL